MQLVKVVNGFEVSAREADRYVDATALCKAAGKKWSHYWANKGTVAFLGALAGEAGIPASQLVEVRKGNSSGVQQGTWIHPRVVIHFAQWASPEFAVAVSGWVMELLTTGKVELKPEEADEHRTLVETLHTMLNEQRAVNASLAQRLVGVENRIASHLATARPISFDAGPQWTVEMRIEERYPEWLTTAKQRATIRRRVNNMIRTLYPGQLVHTYNRDCAYQGPQILLLDRVIDRVYREAQRDGKVAGLGLFTGSE